MKRHIEGFLRNGNHQHFILTGNKLVLNGTAKVLNEQQTENLQTASTRLALVKARQYWHQA